jgi:hypothetical protein
LRDHGGHAVRPAIQIDDESPHAAKPDETRSVLGFTACAYKRELQGRPLCATRWQRKLSDNGVTAMGAAQETSRRGARPILAAAVRERRRTDRIAIASPSDFALADVVSVGPEVFARDALLPYCLDIARRRSLYVSGSDAGAAQRAPFYYLHLRQTAQGVVSVPWGAGGLRSGAMRAPVFVFSPGRCGSTLLSRLLNAADIANVSEPDFYTQVTSAFMASPLNPLRRAAAGAAATMGSDLAAALDPDHALVVKLRAESCRAPELLLRETERRTIFMTRGFEAWARSNGRAFRNPAAKQVRKYLTAMRCYAVLRAQGACHVLHYEDLLAAPDATAQALARFLGREISTVAVAATMKEDSQEGTPLQRGARPDRPGWERRFDGTMALWKSARIKDVRARLGVDELRAE